MREFISPDRARWMRLSLVQQLDAVLAVDGCDTLGICPAGSGKFVCAFGEEFFKPGWHGQDPMAAGRGADIAVAMRPACRKIHRAARGDLAPFALCKIADASFHHQENLILVVVAMQRRAAAGRGPLGHHRNPPAGLLAAEQGASLALFHLGILASDQQDDALATALLEESLVRFTRVGDLFFVARVSGYLGFLARKRGDHSQAQRFYEHSLEIDCNLQFWDGIADGWRNLSLLHTHLGQPDQAGWCSEESVRVCIEHGLHKFDPFYLSGYQAMLRGDDDLASRRFTRLLEMVWASNDHGNVGVVLEALAAVFCGLGEAKKAAVLHGAARAVFDTGGEKPYPPHQKLFIERLDSALSRIGGAAFNALVDEGRTTDLSRVIGLSISV